MATDQCKAVEALEEHGQISNCVAAEVSKQVLSILNQQFASQIESLVRSVLVEQGNVNTNNTEPKKLHMCVQSLIETWHATQVGRLQAPQPDGKARQPDAEVQQVKKPCVQRKRETEMGSKSVNQLECMQRQKIINEAMGHWMDSHEERQECCKFSESKLRSSSKQRSPSRDRDSTFAWLKIQAPKKIFPSMSWSFSSRGGAKQFTKIVPEEADEPGKKVDDHCTESASAAGSDRLTI